MRFASTLAATATAAALATAQAASSDSYALQFVSDLSEFTKAETLITLAEGASLPPYLNGQFVHNGCGAFEMGDRHMSHIFDCFSKLHSWDFAADGSVSMSSKFLSSDFYTDSVSDNDIHPEILFGLESPRFNMAERTAAMTNGKPGPGMYDNNNVNLWDYGIEDSHVIATTDSAVYVDLDLGTLEAARFEFDNFDTTNNGTLSAAHPAYIPGGDKTTINFFLADSNMVTGHCTFTAYKQQYGSSSFDTFFELPLTYLPYMHSFSVTEKYAVFALYSAFMKESCVMGSMTNGWKGVNSCFQWDDKTTTRILVVDHATGELVKDVSLEESFFSFHHVNAYEEDGDVVLDMITNENSAIIQSPVFAIDIMTDKAARDASKDDTPMTSFTRVRIGLGEGEGYKLVVVEPVMEEDGNAYHFDFPLVNSKVHGKKNCFVWGVAGPFAGDSDEYEEQAVVKINLCDEGVEENGEVKADVWKMAGAHYHVGDMQFVANPEEGAEEDDGVLLTTMIDGDRGVGYLRVVDAKTMETIATVYNKKEEEQYVMPFGFHSIWR